MSMDPGFTSCVPRVTFQIKVVYQLGPRLPKDRVLIASCGQFSGITVVQQAAEGKRNGCRIGSRVPCSVPVCGAAQWVKLRQSWPNFKFFDFRQMINNLLERQKFLCIRSLNNSLCIKFVFTCKYLCEFFS